jgi:hypothetical protein
MTVMRRLPITSAFACLLAAGLLLTACGSSDDSTTATTGPVESRPAPPKSDFPPADGRSLEEVLHSAEPAELVVSAAAGAFVKGKNRFPFGVFEKSGATVPDAEDALYFSHVPKVEAEVDNPEAKGPVARAATKALEEPAVGPFPAKVESLETLPAFQAQTTSDDPNAATAVYSTEVDFPSNGEWRIAALIKEGDELKASLFTSAIVGSSPRVPRAGDKAPVIHTPTPADAGGDLSKITTRIPPDTQNKVDYADALGKEPVVLLFATPQFCESRVCGPVVDVAEQVKEEFGDEAAFIHMEIYTDNDPNKPVRPQVKRFHLPTEPWLYVINRKGTITDAVEGAFGVELLTKAVEEVVAE